MELERGMTPKQIKLARALAAGGIPKVQAYRQVYSWRGASANALAVEANKATNHPKVSMLATAIRDGETARIWEDKGRFQNWLMRGITDTIAGTESDITRLKAIELAGRTRFASLYEEPQANEANAALSGAMVDTLAARLQSLLGLSSPIVGDDQSQGPILDTECTQLPSSDMGDTDTPTGGGEGE